MPAKRRRRASRYAELARERAHRAPIPSPPPPRPATERAVPPAGVRPRPAVQPAPRREPPPIAAELRRIGLIGGLLLLLLLGLSRLLG